MTTSISGSTGIDKVQSGAVETGDLPAGSVLQVVQGDFNNAGFSTTSTGQVASGYTLSITPTTSGNKVLAFVNGMVQNNTASRWGAVQIKDTTNGTFSDNVQCLGRDLEEEFFAIWHIFTTTSVSTHTYELYQGSCDDQTKAYRRMNFLLMEIAG